jgi:predicted RNA-binding Zn-ribbon protein involved in translation (DUF1610 family)
METVCQACGYQRKPTDQVPDWQCPSCGRAYAKTSHDSHESLLRYAQNYSSESGSSLVRAVAYKESPDGFTVFICLSSCVLVALLGLFFINESSRYQWPLMALMLVVPWIALMVAYAHRNSLLEELGAYSSFILCVGLCFLTTGVAGVAAINSLAFDAEKAWLRGTPLAVPFGLACAVVARRLDKDKVQQLPLLVWPLLIVVAYLYGGAVVAMGNRWLDHSSPTVYQTTVIDKHVTRGVRSGTHYYVQLEPWGPPEDRYVIEVDRSEYKVLQRGRSVVCMTAHPGAGGIAWGQQVPCVEQTSAER